MKILAISADHPPCHFGGYEIRIKEIMEGLSKRGHQIILLTTIPEYNARNAINNKNIKIIRKLHNQNHARFFPKEVFNDILDTRLIHDEIVSINPDVIYLGHFYFLSKSILPMLSRLTIPLVIDEGGASLKGAWTEHGRWFRFIDSYRSKVRIINWLKPISIKMVLKLSRGRIHKSWSWPDRIHLLTNNQHNLEETISLKTPFVIARVIYPGIDTTIFKYFPREEIQEPITIICPGRFEARKGIEIGILLLQNLISNGVKAKLILTGSVGSEQYFGSIIKTINQCQLNENVKISNMVTPTEMASLYSTADICLFPSQQKFGLSRTPLEAMACGCVVISFGNEGSNEIIEDGINGFLNQSGNVDYAMDIIQRLINSPQLVRAVTKAARKRVEEKHTLEMYVANVEEFLLESIRS